MGLNLHGPIEQELERIQNEKKNVSQDVWKPGDRVVFGDMPGTLVRIIPGSDETWEMRPDDGTTKLFVGYDDIEKYTKKNDPKNSDSTTVPIETGKENDDDPSSIDDPSAIDANPKNKKNAGPKFKVGDEVRHVDEPKARGKVQRFYGPDKQGGYEYAVHWHTAPMGWDSPSQDPEEDLKKA